MQAQLSPLFNLVIYTCHEIHLVNSRGRAVLWAQGMTREREIEIRLSSGSESTRHVFKSLFIFFGATSLHKRVDLQQTSVRTLNNTLIINIPGWMAKK